MSAKRATLHETLAATIERQIRRGTYGAGDRIASVRGCSAQRGVSITTVKRAYGLLEGRGLIRARPQSGYYVSMPIDRGVAVRAPGPIVVSETVDVSRLVLSTLRAISVQHAVPLGSPYPDPRAFPFRKLNRYAYAAGRDEGVRDGLKDALPPGHPALIRQIVRRHAETGTEVDPAEVIVTMGATEAINLCLQAVARPGDTIAVESPTYYAMLHAIERLGMKVVEVPTDPRLGIDPAELAAIVRAQRVAACMVMPNFQNPLGFQMPDARKEELVRLATRLDMPLIENGVYNELHHEAAPPTTLKSYDRKGLVLHCGSFTKSLTSAYRIGWAMPGRYREAVERLKFLNTLTTPSLPQIAIAEFLERDGYDLHLRRIRKAYALQARLMSAFVRRFFPPGTGLSEPRGGYVLWLELARGIDALQLYRQALERGITIGPGHMFSVSGRYRHFIRLNYSSDWSPAIERALLTIARLVKALDR